ncbi:MAG TPA: LLM class F420-dependent oxidoreductase [Acidimicrobiia bacterium]|nr:LLM class F420-dependent oxidoreductase [Acidimicrobiia bacterium]
MKIDIKTNPHHASWDRMVATWQRADEIEAIEGAWVFDHFYPLVGDHAGPCLEGWTTLTALAQATKRLLVGTMVNAMPYRHPALTANMASTVDVISNGRLQLGLGAGWNQEEAGAYGISLGETLRERMDIFDEGVEVIVRLLTEAEVDFDGTHFQLTKARNEPKGIQKPHPPITIGGGGETRTLRTVARWAQHWNLAPSSMDEWARKRDILHRHCDAVGRDPTEIMCSMMAPFDPETPDDLYARLATAQAAGLDKVVVNLASPHDPGHVDEVAAIASRLE